MKMNASCQRGGRCWIAAAMILGLCCPAYLHAQDAQRVPDKELAALGRQMTTFYQKPDAEAFKQMQKRVVKYQDALQAANKKNGFGILTATFLARVHDKHGYSLEGSGPLFDLAREVLAESTTDTTAQFIRDPAEVTPNKLDIWWISFFATGDEKYLGLVLSQTPSTADKNDPPKELSEQLVSRAASWSFRANCRQHEAVRKYAQRALERPEGQQRLEYLQQCVEYAKQDRSSGN